MNKRILIVEDEKNIVDILSFNLSKEGYETLEAYDGEAGLQLALEQNPDLILLDLMLPKMNGFDVCRSLRRENRSTPVIMLTAREEETDKVLGLELGADDYITKPFSMRELLARVKANIRRNEPADKISFALNQRLPEDIVVQDSCEVPSDWHPRYQVSRKTYEYRILNRTFRMPNRRLDTYFYHHKLDVDKMKQAASYLVGEHDFKSFCAVGAQVKTTTRTIYSCEVEKDGNDIITIRVTGNGFLYNMVRIIAGTLIRVGGGEMAPDEIPQILGKKDRTAAGPTAPAHGLTMMGIEYGE